MRFIICLSCCLVCVFGHAYGQTGTYRKNGPAGVISKIAIAKSGDKISGEITAWWDTPSERTGNFEGLGTFKNGGCILKSNTAGESCSVRLNFANNILSATFSDCMENNLPEEFNGVYKKISDMTPGRYKVKTSKAYFYTRALPGSREKAYLIAGNVVTVDLDNIIPGGWVFINYKNAMGKITNGYILQNSLSAYR